jgi:cytochrome b561
MKKYAFEFHRAEYQTLRKEIEEIIRRMRRLEDYAVAGCFVIYGWLSTHTANNPLGKFAWFIPILIPPLFWTNYNALANGTHNIGEYLKKLEDFFAGQPESEIPGGWEHFRHGAAKPPKRINDIFQFSKNIFWLTLLLLTLIVPIVNWIIN